jgi:hypothetical protein
VCADWLRALEEGHLYRSPILEFEVLYSARNAREYAELTEELEALRPLELSDAVVVAALGAQAELARHAAGFHRLAHQDYLVSFDGLQAGHHRQVRPEARERLHESTDAPRRSVKNAVAAQGIVPAVAERPVQPGVGPVGPRPRIGRTGEPEERPVRLDDGEAAHPPTRNARSAAMISGPTSSMSPSRSSRAGDRSSS